MSMGKQIYYHNIRENLKNMHPRLKELAVQAGAVLDNGTIITSSMDESKFAELIIKECMGICGKVAEDAHKQKGSSFLTADGKQLYNGVWGGAMNCGNAIGNHFDVS